MPGVVCEQRPQNIARGRKRPPRRTAAASYPAGKKLQNKTRAKNKCAHTTVGANRLRGPRAGANDEARAVQFRVAFRGPLHGARRCGKRRPVLRVAPEFSPRGSPKGRTGLPPVLPFGANDEARTRYLHLGKVALYRMSYVRRPECKKYYRQNPPFCQEGISNPEGFHFPYSLSGAGML